MNKIKLRYLNHSIDRHGKDRWYFRRRWRRIPLPHPGMEDQPSQHFMDAYQALLEEYGQEQEIRRVVAKAPAQRGAPNITGFIYVLGFGRFVKIGFTRNIQQRIAELGRLLPEDPALLMLFPGSLATEAGLHARFKKYRRNGEWFFRAPELEAWLTESREPVANEN